MMNKLLNEIHGEIGIIIHMSPAVLSFPLVFQGDNPIN